MGNILSTKIKDLLAQYTYNFSTQQITLELLKGQFMLENLVINENKINQILKKTNLPIRLKFGLLKKFSMKLSIISAKLETLNVEDFVLIFGPAEEECEKFEGAEEVEIYNMILKNHVASLKNSSSAKYLDPEIFAETARIRMQKLKEEKTANLKKEAEAATKKKNAPAPNAKENLNILGIEIFELIKNILDCSISIQNIFVIYEDNLPDIATHESLDQLVVMMTFNKFAFSNREITKDTDKDGIFKNFMNISEFLKKSGTWSLSDTAYWNITFESFSLTFQTNNPLYITSVELNKMLDISNAPIVLAKFYETKELNKSRNSFRVISLERISFDIVLFYKETSNIPIHAVFLLFDLGKIEFNLECYKITTLLDVLSYFQTKTIAKSFEIIRPKFKILTPARFDFIADKLKLGADQRSYLADIRRLTVREYLDQINYIHKYQALLKNSVDPELARLIVLNKFCQESRLYRLLFGPRVPDSLKLQPEHIVELLKVKQPIVKPESPPIDPNKPLESLNKHPAVLILNKIHIHFRVQFKFQLNVYALNTSTVENSLIVDTFTLDLLKPVGNLKGKTFISMNKIVLNYNKALFASTSKSKPAIFNNLGKSKLDKSFTQANVENMFEIKSTSLTFEVNLQESISFAKIYLLYGDLKFGAVCFNYMPEILKSFLMNLIVFSKFQEKSFHSSAISKTQKRNIKVIQSNDNNKSNATVLNISKLNGRLKRSREKRHWKTEQSRLISQTKNPSCCVNR